MHKVVRQSKFRHMFGTPGQSDEWYRGVRLGVGISPESNVLKANPTYFAFPFVVNGSVCVVPLTQKSAIAEEPPLIMHESPVLEFAFSPFDDSTIATATQDGSVFIYTIPGSMSKSLTQADAIHTYQASSKRVLSVESLDSRGFHPLASDLLVAVTGDNEIKLYDVASGNPFDLLTANPATTLPVHKGVITSYSWNYDGGLLATVARDKMLRVIDPRQPTPAAETVDHQGAKSSRVVWAGRKDKIITVGFTKTSDREIAVYDPRNVSARLSTVKVETSTPASLMPFYDDDLAILFLGGKGEGNAPLLHFLNEFKTNVPQSGLAALPKWTCNTAKCETFRFLKLTTNAVIPVHFEVPRQNAGALFQDDLYPDTWDGKPSVTAHDWLNGVRNKPNLRSLRT